MLGIKGISRKLWLGFGTVTGLLIVSVAAMLISVRTSERNIGQLTRVVGRRNAAVQALETDAFRYALAVQEYADTSDPLAWMPRTPHFVSSSKMRFIVGWPTYRRNAKWRLASHDLAVRPRNAWSSAGADSPSWRARIVSPVRRNSWPLANREANHRESIGLERIGFVIGWPLSPELRVRLSRQVGFGVAQLIVN
jgi:hypothetical protein